MWPWGESEEEDTSTAASSSTSSTTAATARVTRQQASQSPTPTDFLQLPTHGPRRETPRERLRRVRTPSPRPQSEPSFTFSSNMDEATVQRLMEAAIRATQQSSTQQVQSLKKPELPAFDKRNVEIWIRRIESAFTRVGCTDPKLKFAHLEAKFEVGEDPKVDEYLYGDATSANWEALLTYFRTRYGPTKKDKAIILINGLPREGRTPSQLAAALDDKTKDVTIDDIKKQQLLKQLPSDILKQIVDRVDKLSFHETAQLADKWFDPNGNPLISNNTTSINSVTNTNTGQPTAPQPPAAAAPAAAPSFSAPFVQEDNEADINAIRARQAQKQNHNNNNRFANSRGRPNNNSNRGGFNNNFNRGGFNNNNRGNASNGRPNSSANKPAPQKVCPYHIKFGDEAERCLDWCMLWAKHQASNDRASK